MKIFQCSNCYLPVFFENTSCESCGSSLGYIDTEYQIYSLNPLHSSWAIENTNYRYCNNKENEVCNWLVPETEPSGYCTSCRLNRTIPDLSIPENHEKWKKLEASKQRLVYSLQKLTLPLRSKQESPSHGLCFDFLSTDGDDSDAKIMTGHSDGVITIILDEADSVSREQIRKSLNEPYRTLIGHFRHEVGHYYWQLLLSSNDQWLGSFRKIFGDERENYENALKKHYQNGPPSNWKEHYISEYSSSHPWEDWAETWAHYFHIIDTMETAFYFGLKGSPELSHAPHLQINSVDPYKQLPFKAILHAIAPLFFAVNSINRSMGIPDVYPFVISNIVQAKLEFIHEILQGFQGKL